MAGVKICEIQAGMRSIEVTGRIVGLSSRKRVQTRFGLADVATATLEDETGSIHINLWRQQIESASEGKTVKIINGFVRTYGNRLELNVGSDGQIIPVNEE